MTIGEKAVSSIVHGSPAFDQMRLEIRQVLGTTVGAMAQDEITSIFGEGYQFFAGELGEWNLGVYANGTVKVHVKIGGSFALVLTAEYLSETSSCRGRIGKFEHQPVSMHLTQEVHSRLPDFVGGMIKRFPNVRSVTQIHEDAAQYMAKRRKR